MNNSVTDVQYPPLGSFTLLSGYDRKAMRFRNPVNVAEMVNHCNSNSPIWIRDMNNQARRVKVNGKVRTWKRDPNRIEVPYKYGMYEYGTLTGHDLADVLIPVVEIR